MNFTQRFRRFGGLLLLAIALLGATAGDARADINYSNGPYGRVLLWDGSYPPMVDRGALRRLGRGLYAHVRESRFGAVPPSDEQLLRAFLGDSLFVITGPPAWNALDLGATALHADTLVYNTKRSGKFQIGGRTYRMRRVAFPRKPSKEWFAIDLLVHAEEAGVARSAVADRIGRALATGRLKAARLRATARRYARRPVRALLDQVLTVRT